MAWERLRVASAPLPPDGRREVLELVGEPASVPRARRFVREALARWGREDFAEAGTLLVSELATNVVLHARSPLEVALVEDTAAVLLLVADESLTLPVVRRHDRESGTGRGLWLLDQYSSSCGVERTTTGKRVWAVLCPELAADAEEIDEALSGWLDDVEGL